MAGSGGYEPSMTKMRNNLTYAAPSCVTKWTPSPALWKQRAVGSATGSLCQGKHYKIQRRRLQCPSHGVVDAGLFVCRAMLQSSSQIRIAPGECTHSRRSSTPGLTPGRFRFHLATQVSTRRVGYTLAHPQGGVSVHAQLFNRRFKGKSRLSFDGKYESIRIVFGTCSKHTVKPRRGRKCPSCRHR